MKYLIGISTVLVLEAGVMFWMNHNGSAHQNERELVTLEEKEEQSQFGADRVRDDLKPTPSTVSRR